MLRRLVAAAVHQRRTLAVLVVLLLAGAAIALPRAKTDALPEFGPPTVEVQTEALGLSATEVEQLVTGPIERMLLNGLPFLKTVRSTSVPSLSSVDLIFEPGTSLFTARQLVQERLTVSFELPNVSKPPAMLQSTSASNRLMMVGLTSPRLSLIDMSVLAKFDIAPRLLGVPGVAKVALWGENDLQLQVQVDPQKLRDRGVTLDQVIASTGNGVFTSPLTYLEASTPGNGGFVETNNQRLAVQHLLPVQSPADVGKFRIQDNTAGVKLSDVATVVEDHQPLIGDASVHGGPGLVLVIEKLPGANTMKVTNAVNAALDAMAPGLTDLQMDRSLYKPATFVKTAEHNLTRTGSIAAIALLISVGLLTLDWRRILVCLLAAPVPIVAAAWVMYLRGETFDSMTFTGLVTAVALAVYDAVVVSEACVRALRNRGQLTRFAALADAGSEVGRPLVFANLITAVALIPVLFLADLPEEPFLPRMAGSFAMAVAAAAITALLLTPALVAVLPHGDRLRDRPRPPAETVLRGLQRGIWPFARRPVALLATAGVLLVGAAAATQLSPRFSPHFDETDLMVSFEGSSGTALPEMTRVLDRVAAELRDVPGVRDVGTLTGRAIGSDQVVGSGSGDVWINLDPRADHARTVAAVRRVVAGYPGMTRHVTEYFHDRVVAAQKVQDAPLVVRVYGNDYSVMTPKADEIRNAIADIPGVVAPMVEALPTEPTIQVSVDLDAAARAGAKPGDIRRAAATLVQGLTVGNVYQDQKVFEVVVAGQPAVRHDLSSVQSLLIDTATGGHVRLGDVASVKLGSGFSAIRHEDTSKVVDVTAGIHGRRASAVADDVRARLAGIQFPLATHATVLNAYSKLQTAHWRVVGAAVAVGLIVFLLMQAALDSWLLAGLALLTVPITLAGAVVAIWIDNDHLTLGSLAGLVVVGAIGVRAALGLLCRVRADVGEYWRSRSAVDVEWACRDQAAATIQALASIAVMCLPFVMMRQIPGSELARPAAVALLGGVASIAVAILIVVPGLIRPWPAPVGDAGPMSAAGAPPPLADGALSVNSWINEVDRSNPPPTRPLDDPDGSTHVH